MARITNAELTITTDRPQNNATVMVNCDIEFTEVEVNAMDLLGLQYTLHCEVLNQYLLAEEPVVTYHHQSFPRRGYARRHEHAVFEKHLPMDNMHERLIGKDKLVAQLKLKNVETGAEEVQRTDDIEVDLAA